MSVVDPQTGEITKLVDGRMTMRTVADALAKLIELGAWTAEAEATISVPLLKLPDGRVVGSVGVSTSQGTNRRRILMPAAAEARAKDMLGRRIRFPVERLEGARVGRDGIVQLRDGTPIRAVELVPVRLSQTLSEQQETILYLTLGFMRRVRPDLAKVLDECYRPIDEGSLPGRVTLDYAAIARLGQLRLPILKAIVRHVTERMPHVGRQTIANALTLAGLRLPRSGPRARSASRPRRAATLVPQSD